MSTKPEPASTISKGLLFVYVPLLAFFIYVFISSPISSPDFLELPSLAVTSTKNSPWNNQLQKVTKLGEGILNKPEDVVIDHEGALITATRDGWIKKMHKNGTWEFWKFIASDSMLGITKSATPGHFIVCDAASGLLKVSKDTITVLSSHVNGEKIKFADDAIEASDGTIYFSDPSTKFGFHDWYLDMLEAKPYGRLLKYDPVTMETSIEIDGLGFANGVALSMDEEFLVICETWKFRVLKYYLKGEKKGKTEIFVDKLPGGPDNIKLAPDGSFWIACVELRLRGLDFVQNWRLAKHVVATFPEVIERTKATYKKAMVVNVGLDGKIIQKFDDSTGEVLAFATSVLEFEDHIYVGSLKSNFIGKLKLR